MESDALTFDDRRDYMSIPIGAMYNDAHEPCSYLIGILSIMIIICMHVCFICIIWLFIYADGDYSIASFMLASLMFITMGLIRVGICRMSTGTCNQCCGC